MSDVSEPDGTQPTNGGGSSGSTPPSKSGPKPNPPVTDAGVPDATKADAGCSGGPVLASTGGPGCQDIWQSACGIPSGVVIEDGLSQEECDKVCGTPPGPQGSRYWGCGYHFTADVPGPSFDCYTCVEGRRPEGYVDPAVDATLAGWLAHAADLERVSVDAFQILGRELAHHGAPPSLVERAARAEADEVRHARALATLARREGATVSTAPVTHGDVRGLLAIALENAVEGCIRETYGALVAGWQARHAERSDLRRAMKAIHPEETSHAELAWDVHAWLADRLTAAERAQVERAMADAVAQLAHAARSPMAADLRSALGLPAPAEAVRLVEGLRTHLFTVALAA